MNLRRVGLALWGYDIRALRRTTARSLLLFMALLCTPAPAQEKSYWLVNSGTVIGSCPGRAGGEPLRAANGGNQWVLITATVTCRDVGDGYTFSVDYMSVQINPSARARVERDVLNFDWVALAVFQPHGNGQTINWLYDEALPVKGQLEKTSREKIYFGNLTFPKVSKAEIAKASNFTFYMTAQGVPFVFGLR